jgi:PhnB protein
MADQQPPQPSPVSIYLFPKGGRASEAVDFYRRAFGAEEAFRMPAEDGKRLMHAHLRINGASVMLSDEFPEMPQSHVRPMGGFTIHLQVDDADTWYNRAVEAGCQVQSPLADQFWGDRYGTVRDPFDVDWSIASPIKK